MAALSSHLIFGELVAAMLPMI